MEKRSQPCGFEFWGGIECTFNRVGDRYFDQLKFSGHYHRPEDIEHIARLGINKIRYPVLWEYHEPKFNSPIDWTWISQQLNALQANHITPIAGLVHHGSGPKFTDLLSPDFPTLLAAYAAKVAKQFPWLEYYTPVNEPLTTARFSGFYGHWYPHATTDVSFVTMLLHEVKAIVLAMREIRKVNPDAKLIQTEDLAKTYSTPPLQYQADFENERRWLTYDLLCGRIDSRHPLWSYFQWLKIPEKDLMFFQDNPCIPDIAGFNYYLTSERFLDDQLQRHPPHTWGGNMKHRYADTEAIRVDHEHPYGLNVLLKEAWNRFHLPLALTEVFLSCTEDEQIRWLHDVWNSCCLLKDDGVDIRAMSFWALLGEFGWNTLVTVPDGEYESGAFDVRDGVLKPTAIAEFIRSLTASGTYTHPMLKEPGWWKRRDRFYNCLPTPVL